MTDATSVEQIGQAKPQRPRGAPARTRSHYDAILALLRERGQRGVLGSELYDAPHLYGRSPSVWDLTTPPAADGDSENMAHGSANRKFFTPQSSQLPEIWPLGLNHSTSKLEKSERSRRRNENDNRLLAEFSSFVLDYCQASKMDDAQRAEFSRDVLGFLNDK